ncbi:hypothetical protein C5167_008276 [Papaver somniferum]|uniref:Uncharacterized protein n=1 Tax=Papaver somniferum TaxID=3469 RepID=A0A4Y7JXT7_PAPSO|nr:hypothetical protein C5167_008276 [Papaver somniferum]
MDLKQLELNSRLCSTPIWIWMVLKNHQEPATFWSNRCNLKLMCSQYVITSTIRHQNHQAIQVART